MSLLKDERLLNLVSSASLVALILLCTLWELWLAPLRPGGSMLVLKVLQLLLNLRRDRCIPGF